MRGLRSNVGKKQKPSYNDAKILTRTGEKQNYNNNNKKKNKSTILKTNVNSYKTKSDNKLIKVVYVVILFAQTNENYLPLK